MPIAKTARNLTRRQLRYRLYRIQSDDPVEKKDGLKAHFESQDEFDGWHNFGKTWDTGPEGKFPEGHYVAQPLHESLEAAWQRRVLLLAADFPVADEGEDDIDGEDN